MSELESIEKLVEKYKPRMEKILRMEVGNVKVREYSPSQYVQDLIEDCKKEGKLLTLLLVLIFKNEIKNTIKKEHYDSEMIVKKDRICVNQKLLNKEKQKDLGVEKRVTLHELTHILDNNNNLSTAIRNHKIKRYIQEGFAEYVAWDFPEIYQDQEMIECLKKHKEERIGQLPIRNNVSFYALGYEFFKKVGDEIGRENILKVFKKPPKSMEEIKNPSKYLERIGGSNDKTK